MATAKELVQQYLNNPKPRVNVVIPNTTWGSMSATFVWDDGQWWHEVGPNVTAIEHNCVNAAILGAGWYDLCGDFDMPDVVQERLVRGVTA